MPKFNAVVIALTACVATVSVAQADPLGALNGGQFHLAGRLHSMPSAPAAPSMHSARDHAPSNHEAGDDSNNRTAAVDRADSDAAPNKSESENESETKIKIKAQARAHAQTTSEEGDSA